MPFDDEAVDVPVGCTFDLFIKDEIEAEEEEKKATDESEASDSTCLLLIKSTCYKSFTIKVDTALTTQ